MKANVFARSAQVASIVDNVPSSISIHAEYRQTFLSGLIKSARGGSLAMLMGAFALAGAGCGAGDLQEEDLQGEDLQAGEGDELAESQEALAPWPPSASLQFDTNFESGSYSPWSTDIAGAGKVFIITDDGTAANSPNSGSKAVKMTVSGDGAYRAELKNSASPPNGARLDYDSEYWIGFAFRVEKWAQSDWAMVFQTHGVPSNWTNCKSGRNPVSITMTSDGKLAFAAINNPKLTVATGGAGGVVVWPVAPTNPVTLNAWQRWVIHLRPSASSSGITQAWLNGTEVYKRVGANVDALDTCGAPQEPWIYPKIGIYKSYSNTGAQAVVYDDFRIFKGSGYPSSYNLVRPPGLPAK